MDLTKTEKEILKYTGYPNEKIAEKFYISIGTVKRHFANLREKFKVKNKEQLLIIALRGGYLNIDEVDCGFWNPNGEYIEDKQIIEWRKV